MTTDIRAKVYCNLGKVVSGDFSDDYLQENGVVRTRGTVVLNGIYSPPVGEIVQFAYYRNGTLSRLPRTLRVISFFADPFRRITTVEIGCKFTYFANRKPPVKNPSTKEENADVPCEVFEEAIIPISAAYVFEQCLDALGLVSDPIPLTNKFSVEEFDLSAGYVQVMSDLLSSEGYFCFLDESETVRIRSFNDTVNTGPLIKSNQIIDLGPIGVGDLPGDSVLVRYSFLTLKAPEELTAEEKAIRNWELERNVSTAGENVISAYYISSITYVGTTVYISGYELKDYYFPDYTITETTTTYDKWDRVTKRETVTIRPIAAVNPSYLAHQVNHAVFNSEFTTFGINYQPLPPGDVPCEEKQVELYYYAVDPPEDGTCKTPEGNSTDYDSLLRKEIVKYDSKMKILGAIWQGTYYAGAIGSSVAPYGIIQFSDSDYKANYEVERTYEYYDKQLMDLSQQSRDIIAATGASTGGLTGFENVATKQVTKRYLVPFYTQRGQKLLSNSLVVAQTSYNIATVFRNAFGIALSPLSTGMFSDSRYTVYAQVQATYYDSATRKNLPARGMAGGEFQLVSIDYSQSIGRFAGMDARPSQSSRVNTANQKGAPTESVAEIEWVTGSVESNAVIEFSMPYAPDDEITYSEQAGYGVIKSDANAKALNYGRVQNALRLGNRNGISIQLSADIMPPRAFDPIYIEANGIKGQYRINGTSYSFDSSGIIASTDALFWGGVT